MSHHLQHGQIPLRHVCLLFHHTLQAHLQATHYACSFTNYITSLSACLPHRAIKHPGSWGGWWQQKTNTSMSQKYMSTKVLTPLLIIHINITPDHTCKAELSRLLMMLAHWMFDTLWIGMWQEYRCGAKWNASQVSVLGLRPEEVHESCWNMSETKSLTCLLQTQWGTVLRPKSHLARQQ